MVVLYLTRSVLIKGEGGVVVLYLIGSVLIMPKITKWLEIPITVTVSVTVKEQELSRKLKK